MTWRVRRVAVLLLLVLYAPSALAQSSTSYQGMLLAEALQQLQARGLRIIFSSAIVPSDLRVSVEPRASAPRKQLDELLAPHGLAVREGPGGTLQVVQVSGVNRPLPQSRGSLEGRVVDTRTAMPLPRALVRIEGHQVELQTDAAGEFAIAQLAEGTRIVTASAAGYLPARRRVAIGAGSLATVTLRLIPEARRYREFISVTDSAPPRTDRGVASELSLDRDDFARLHGSIAEDPLRIVQAFPGATAVDDFRSDFIVRGSPFRHAAVVVDGVSTHWLRHTALGRGTTGSLTMVSGLVVERATLRTGAYPRRNGDYLGSELDLVLRQGSRSEFVLRGAVGGAHAVLAAEGPLGRRGPTGTAPGSWLVSARQSYLEWPPERSGSSRPPFGFSDGLAKVVFDVQPTQQLAITAIAGISNVDEDEDNPIPGDLADGTNRASAVSVSWRSAFGPAFRVRQQTSIVTQRFRNKEHSGHERDGGANHLLAYRADLSRAMAGGMLEAGGLIERIRISHTSRSPNPIFIEGSSWLRSGFAHFSWPLTPSFTLSPGVRVTSSSTTSAPVVSRWLLGEWSFGHEWSFIGSFGASRQLPELAGVPAESGSRALRPERAAHWELGIEHQLTNGIRWQATVFARREADVIRPPDVHPRLVANALVWPASGERYANALRGTSRGFELLVSRRSSRGLTGWATYAYGRTRHRDTIRGETFWAEFDQPHTFNVFALYRFARTTSVGATFRAGSNFPVLGYLTKRDGRLFVGRARNEVRLSPYARLDLRADHQFQHFGLRFTLFVEMLNALNRENLGLAPGSVDPVTAEAVGFTERLLRRRISAGVLFEF